MSAVPQAGPLPPLAPSFAQRGLAVARAYARAHGARDPELALVPALMGLPILLPIRAGWGGATRLLIATPAPDGAGLPALLDTTGRWALRSRSPEHERRLLLEYERWRPHFTPYLRELHEEVAPLVAARWVEDLFFEIEGAHGTLLAYVHWHPDGSMRSLNFGPAFGAIEQACAQNALVLPRLPLDVPFRVIWGGSDPADNLHHLSRQQRFALDIEPLDGRPAEVRAPCDAAVVEVHDGEDDALPKTDPSRDRERFGNHVVLACGAALLTLAHLERGSLRVAPGARLAAGQPIARVGDSGRSSRLHLHVHATAEDRPYNALPLLVAAPGAARELRRGGIVIPAELAAPPSR